MTNYNLLEEEFSKFTIHPRTIHVIEKYRKKKNLRKEEINILDWGCGRGRETLWLREKGYNTYGVDIDIEAISNGIGLFKYKGYDNSTLRLIGTEGKTDFPDNFFHVIFSTYVFEHISNIESVAREMARITAKGGIGLHRYPANKSITEGHLFMPFVHWLKKNKLRKLLIFAYVIVGKEPYWNGELKNRNLKEKVDTFYKYSINNTFYRNYHSIKRIFEKVGFNVSFETINHQKVVNHKLIGKLSQYRLFHSIINYMILTFIKQILYIEKI